MNIDYNFNDDFSDLQFSVSASLIHGLPGKIWYGTVLTVTKKLYACISGKEYLPRPELGISLRTPLMVFQYDM